MAEFNFDEYMKEILEMFDKMADCMRRERESQDRLAKTIQEAIEIQAQITAELKDYLGK